ncbi:PLD nuclease N-terminal domain-containing protein [Roseovarius arcticus]|uniref:PLD nuclease N-terminal domain-containing protein n=1 Tax=Roseovarius arcticus TaxID=2547404 RepID=UPI00111071AC|nr:PLD nuclease N-terminal domain-containing protein [Roseovarius arcticus]
MVDVTSVGGFIVLVCDVWAIVLIFGSAASSGRKVLWIVTVILLPILGFVLWLIFGPRSAKGSA